MTKYTMVQGKPGRCPRSMRRFNRWIDMTFETMMCPTCYEVVDAETLEPKHALPKKRKPKGERRGAES